mgnify:CR=1 FL=1
MVEEIAVEVLRCDEVLDDSMLFKHDAKIYH